MECNEENTMFEFDAEKTFNPENYDDEGVFKGLSKAEAMENTRQWEALCRRCGACCIMRDWDNDPKITKGYCPHLRPKKNMKCRIYRNRNRIGIRLPYGKCNHISRVDWRFLPETCGYKEHLARLNE